jgi:hypothetical protein
MKNSLIHRAASGIALLGATAGALAHEGHGMSGPHWHATDVWGFAVLAGLVAVAVWLSRGGK